MKITLIAVCGLIATMIAVNPALAQGRMAAPKTKPFVETPPGAPAPAKRVAGTPPKRAWVGRKVTISESERDAIRAYVRNRIDGSKLGKPNGVPQGLAKKVAWPRKLPADWQKNCVRGHVLPVEVHRDCQPLPEELTATLPPPPPGTVLLAVDGTVVRVGYPTYEILDAFDVLAPPAELNGPRPARPAAVAQRGAYSEMIPIVASHASTN